MLSILDHAHVNTCTIFWLCMRYSHDKPVLAHGNNKATDTVKFLDFRTLENFYHPKTGKKRFYHRVMHPKDADSTANSEYPDQTAPRLHYLSAPICQKT